jgi:hypothetical protein
MLAATPGSVQAQTRTEAQPANVAVAVSAPTHSFGTAAGPIAGMIQIEAKSSNWFKFKYNYDNSDSDNKPTQALVGLKMQTPGCVSFAVWTPGRLCDPQHNHYIVVKNKTTAACSYSLSISGPDVSF